MEIVLVSVLMDILLTVILNALHVDRAAYNALTRLIHAIIAFLD